MLEINGKQVDLQYKLGKARKLERKYKRPLPKLLSEHDGMVSVDVLIDLVLTFDQAGQITESDILDCDQKQYLQLMMAVASAYTGEDVSPLALDQGAAELSQQETS